MDGLSVILQTQGPSMDTEKKRSKLIIDREEGTPRCERGREEEGEGEGGGRGGGEKKVVGGVCEMCV